MVELAIFALPPPTQTTPSLFAESVDKVELEALTYPEDKITT